MGTSRRSSRAEEEHPNAMKYIESRKAQVKKDLEGTELIVALLGAGEKGLDQRRSMAKELLTEGILAVIPEDALPSHLAPSILERKMLSEEDLDIAFVNVESWGSAAEFSEFRNDMQIAPKLRVLVERARHPLYGSSKGYLTDAYLTHDAVFGHVYMYASTAAGQNDRVPTPGELVLKLAERYRQWKAFG
jgi:hypothetical protein